MSVIEEQNLSAQCIRVLHEQDERIRHNMSISRNYFYGLPINGTTHVSISEIHDPSLSGNKRRFDCIIIIRNSNALSAFITELAQNVIVNARDQGIEPQVNIEIGEEFTNISMYYAGQPTAKIFPIIQGEQVFNFGEASAYEFNVTGVSFAMNSKGILDHGKLCLRAYDFTLAPGENTRDLVNISSIVEMYMQYFRACKIAF